MTLTLRDIVGGHLPELREIEQAMSVLSNACEDPKQEIQGVGYIINCLFTRLCGVHAILRSALKEGGRGESGMNEQLKLSEEQAKAVKKAFGQAMLPIWSLMAILEKGCGEIEMNNVGQVLFSLSDVATTEFNNGLEHLGE